MNGRASAPSIAVGSSPLHHAPAAGVLMDGLPADLRERAAHAAFDAFWPGAPSIRAVERALFLAVVDAVVDALAGAPLPSSIPDYVARRRPAVRRRP